MKRTDDRVAKNTMMLYTRQIVIMLVSLYTVRVILRTLGEIDYGLYTVVASIVTMFTIFSGAMASASQRFFSYDLGKNEQEHLKRTFSMTLLIYGMIILLAFFLMETIGLWYVMHRLVVPEGREVAVIWIYETSIISLICTLITTPYMALMIAHENMNAYAIISIIEAGLKVVVALALQVVTGDRLIVYGILTAFSTLIITNLYQIYCKRRYEESKFNLYWDKSLFKEIFSFTGWNMFGSAVGTFKIQAVNVILNQKFDQVVVTSRGIATSVNSAVVSFSQSFGTAVRPVIIKEYAKGQKDAVNSLISGASKATFLLMYIFILPLSLEMDYVLRLWLGEVPRGAVIFTILTLIDALIDSASYPLMTAAQATGKIKLYQAVVGGIQLMNLPVSLIVVMLGAPAYSVFAIAVVLTILAFVARLTILSKIMDFNVIKFVQTTVLPLCLTVIITILPSYGVTLIMSQSIFRVMVTTAVSLMSIGVSSWFAVATESEKALILNVIRRKRGQSHGKFSR